MADFAERIVKLVAELTYKPNTQKAMARYFDVLADDWPL